MSSQITTPHTGVESPSLCALAGVDVPAYELKFLLAESQIREVEDRVKGLLFLDPHADPNLGNAYATTSLYCDTAQLAVFHAQKGFKRRKHRLRRYGRAAEVFLERKTKWGDRVQKRRTLIADGELALLAAGMSPPLWPGHWFHQHLQQRRLLPVCRVAYERVALVGLSAEGPLRLTFDRHIRGVLTDEWCVADFAGGVPILTGQVICEFKYRSALPSLFKGIIQSLQLTPTPVSKYRAFVRASGRVADRRVANA